MVAIHVIFMLVMGKRLAHNGKNHMFNHRLNCYDTYMIYTFYINDQHCIRCLIHKCFLFFFRLAHWMLFTFQKTKTQADRKPMVLWAFHTRSLYHMPFTSWMVFPCTAEQSMSKHASQNSNSISPGNRSPKLWIQTFPMTGSWDDLCLITKNGQFSQSPLLMDTTTYF